jgi:hypothetical protein
MQAPYLRGQAGWIKIPTAAENFFPGSFYYFYRRPKNNLLMSLHNISPDTRLLIVQADDAGLSQSVNQSIISAFERKVIHSASIMVPCPFFDEIADYARAHPEFG